MNQEAFQMHLTVTSKWIEEFTDALFYDQGEEYSNSNGVYDL